MREEEAQVTAKKKSQNEAEARAREIRAGFEFAIRVDPYFGGLNRKRNRDLGKPRVDYVHDTPGRLSAEDVRELRRRIGWAHEYRDVAAFFGIDREYAKEVANYRARKNVD